MERRQETLALSLFLKNAWFWAISFMKAILCRQCSSLAIRQTQSAFTLLFLISTFDRLEYLRTICSCSFSLPFNQSSLSSSFSSDIWQLWKDSRLALTIFRAWQTCTERKISNNANKLTQTKFLCLPSQTYIPSLLVLAWLRSFLSSLVSRSLQLAASILIPNIIIRQPISQQLCSFALQSVNPSQRTHFEILLLLKKSLNSITFYIMLHRIASKALKRLSFKSCYSLAQGGNIQAVLKKYSEELAQSKAMEAMIPRQFSEENLLKLSLNQRFSQGSNHIQSLNKTFSEPIWDLLDRGGKRWRPVLCMLIAELLGHPRSTIFDIASLCQIIHNGTLIIDDIEDSSTVRRNKPCVHLLYGIDIAVNAGNLMYFAPLLSLMKSGKYSTQIMLKLNQIYTEEMVQLHVGQGWDILWHNVDKLQGKYPTETQYLQMTAHKTGVLARLSSRMVCASLSASPEQTSVLIDFVENLGVAFQIQDDLLNLQGEQFKKTKGYNGQDIHQGKITLMVIHHLQNSKNPEKLLAILKKRTQDEKQIAEAITLLNSTGSLQYARIKMLSLIQSSFSLLDSHFPPSSKQTQSLLKQLAQYGIKRQK